MCGFAGIFKKNGSVEAEWLSQAAHSLRHRGPDDQGIWLEEGIGLAHARLSIHDLSPAGHQPMFSANKEWVMVYNGEIYNFLEIKHKLLSHHAVDFQSGSDTEVLLNAIACFGLEKTLQQCRGMFAFALWNRLTKKLYLARDRFGEKPLYYGHVGNDFIFASELKALQLHNKHLPLNQNALASYMRFAYVPTPYSIYNNIFKLAAGEWLEIDLHHHIIKKSYWRAEEVLGADNNFIGSYVDAVNELENKLKEILSLHMAADVPLGAFLSGGIDSSTIVALMQSLSKEKVRTFSIGFDDQQYNEAKFAKAVANHLGTDHTEMYVTAHDIAAVVPTLPYLYDEPFADSSQIPMCLLSKIAKSRVTVSLSGDAGDELFGGYNRYLLAETVKKKILDKHVIKYAITHTPAAFIKALGYSSRKYSLLTDKLLKLQHVIRHSNGSSYNLYRNLCSQIYQPQQLVLQSEEYDVYGEKGLLKLLHLPYQAWMMFADSRTYLIDDILTKVDRAAMAHSLETRIPFLDHELYAFAWSLPMEYKIKQGIGKRILRDVLYRYVPQKLIDRPKMGFGVPLDQWLRGPLKEWAADLLNVDTLQRQGYLSVTQVQTYWQEHLSGKRNWQYALWNILMFQAWLCQN